MRVQAPWSVFLWLLCFTWSLSTLWSAPEIPPAPTQYVTDTARVLTTDTVAQLNQRLDQFERESSCQIVVYIARRLPQDAELNDYVHQLFQAWKIGQKGRNNGVLFAVFVDDHKLRIETGLGLEGKFPDILVGRIIRDEISPRLKEGNFNQGIRSGVEAITQAAFAQPAPRPRDVSLDSSRARGELGYAPRPLDDMIKSGRPESPPV